MALEVDLGRLGPWPDREPYRGRVLYLRGRKMIVVPERREGADGWRCGVVAQRVPDVRPWHVNIRVQELQGGLPRVRLNPEADHVGWAMVWQAAVWRRPSGDRGGMVARALAAHALIRDTPCVGLTDTVFGEVMCTARIGRSGLRIVLDRLCSEEFLTPALGRVAAGVEGYRLVLPDDGTGPRYVEDSVERGPTL